MADETTSTESQSIFRSVWTLALVISLCGFSFFVFSAYVKWQINPEIKTTTRHRNTSDFPAPAVTLCSNLFARDDTANFFNAMKIFTERQKGNFTQEECSTLAANLHWCQPAFGALVKSICGNYDLKGLNVLKFIDKSSLKVDEAFFLCSNGMCDTEIFRIFTEFGICYTRNMMPSSMIFNTEVLHDDFKKLVTHQSKEAEPTWTPEKGYKNESISIPYRAKEDSANMQPILKEIDKENVCALKVFRVFIHKPNEIVTPYHESVHMNFEEFMEVKVSPQSYRIENSLKRFSPEFRKCYFEGERKLKFYKTYSKANCEWECRANLTLEACGCVKFSMLREKNTKICDIFELACTLGITTTNCNCYEPCIDVKYKSKTEKSEFTRRYFSKSIPKSSAISWLEVSSNVDTVEEIERVISYKFESFIADVGGYLALFLGCSLLTAVEILYFCFGSCYALRRNRGTEDGSAIDDARKWTANSKVSVTHLEKELTQLKDDFSDMQKAFVGIKASLTSKNIYAIDP